MRLSSGYLMTLLGVMAASSVAHADKRVTDMTPGLAKEATSCAAQKSGLEKIVAGATDPAVAADAATVQVELTLVTQYCDEVTALVAFLQANADTPYKKVERELDERDNKVRKLRKDVKKSVETNEAAVRRLIAARTGSRSTVDTSSGAATPTPPAKKREVPLPPLPGSWKISGGTAPDAIDYTDKGGQEANLTLRTYAASCASQRAAIEKKYGDLVSELPPVANAKELGIQWTLRTRTNDKLPRSVTLMCTQVGKSGILATLKVIPADQTALADQLLGTLAYMIQTHTTPTP